jgi:hypothetical protein
MSRMDMLEVIGQRTVWIAGSAWTDRKTEGVTQLSDQLGFIVWCSERRGPGWLSWFEKMSLLNFALTAREIELERVCPSADGRSSVNQRYD